MTTRHWALLIILSILWGGAFFFAAIAVKELPPLTLVFCRVFIAALSLYIFLKISGQKLPSDAKIWAAFLVMGLLNNIIPFSLLFWAQTNISSGLASILNATTPIFSILVAHFVLADERITFNKFIGVLLGFIGVAVLLGGAALTSSNLAIMSIVACLAAALSYGFAGVFGRRFKRLGIKPSVSAFGQLTGSSVLMLPLIIVFDQPWTLNLPGQTAILSILTLAIVSTAIAYLIFFNLLASVGAVNVMLVTLLVPVSAIILGSLFLDEQLETRHYLGMSLILLGLIAVDGRLLPKRAKNS
ncbi:MAG: DMT family transporter [OCS116 cluster bacterium]|nr:DMT family transporter [OCS116 cluster bacterium]